MINQSASQSVRPYVSLLKECSVTCFYICTIIAIPELLEANRLPPYLVSLPIILLMVINVPDKGSLFHPAALYALWFNSNSLQNNNQLIS